MIISVSRRTDIPAYYSKWLFNRLEEEYCITINPMNPTVYYKIPLSPNIVDAIVFWSKNPYPMLKYMTKQTNCKRYLLEKYKFYFQYTITAYDTDIEKNLPLKKYLTDTFINLSKEIGKERVIWRYDPILLSPKYTLDYHFHNFAILCQKLAPYTKKVIISFLNIYKKNKMHCEKVQATIPNTEEKTKLFHEFAKISHDYGIQLETCAENLHEATKFPIYSAHCIDLQFINKLTGKNLLIDKDPYQREFCGCAKSYDIGMYNCCYNGCIYCYAAYNSNKLEENKRQHNPNSPILLGEVPQHAKIIEKTIISPHDSQLFLI